MNAEPNAMNELTLSNTLRPAEQPAEQLSEQSCGQAADSHLSEAENRTNWFYQICDVLIHLLLPKPAEPIIHLKYDRLGQAWYYVYHPATGQTNWFSSEQELRAWLKL